MAASLLEPAGREDAMTKTRMGLVAALVSAAVAAWWYKLRTTGTPRMGTHERGETIYRSTPQPLENDALGG
jgi:hypothetical protein